MTEAVRVNGRTAVYMSCSPGGFPESGGTSTARQEGDQYTLRCKKTDYTAPAVHDTLTTVNYGILDMKEKHSEGDHWALRATGKVSRRTEF